MSDPTQKQKILAYLRKHHYITRMDAFRHCGCCNLWARISEMEQEGHRFDRRTIKTKNGTRVMQYWLVAAGKKAAA